MASPILKHSTGFRHAVHRNVVEPYACVPGAIQSERTTTAVCIRATLKEGRLIMSRQHLNSVHVHAWYAVDAIPQEFFWCLHHGCRARAAEIHGSYNTRGHTAHACLDSCVRPTIVSSRGLCAVLLHSHHQHAHGACEQREDLQRRRTCHMMYPRAPRRDIR